MERASMGGGPGNDVIYGNRGNDVIYGGSGNDASTAGPATIGSSTTDGGGPEWGWLCRGWLLRVVFLSFGVAASSWLS